jgi:hypothetical protein
MRIIVKFHNLANATKIPCSKFEKKNYVQKTFFIGKAQCLSHNFVHLVFLLGIRNVEIFLSGIIKIAMICYQDGKCEVL